MDNSQALIRAIYENKVEDVARHLVPEINLGEKIRFNMGERERCGTPFEWAVQCHGNPEVISMLVRYGADPYETNQNGVLLLNCMSPAAREAAREARIEYEQKALEHRAQELFEDDSESLCALAL